MALRINNHSRTWLVTHRRGCAQSINSVITLVPLPLSGRWFAGSREKMNGHGTRGCVYTVHRDFLFEPRRTRVKRSINGSACPRSGREDLLGPWRAVDIQLPCAMLAGSRILYRASLLSERSFPRPRERKGVSKGSEWRSLWPVSCAS